MTNIEAHADQTLPTLADGFGRRFAYLRLSLTDVCNFRCLYCLPAGYRRTKNAAADLSLEEIARLVRGFARLGLWKVRLTGGEPTLRPEFEAIARTIADIPGIRRLAMTTNGYRLPQRARAFRDAGVEAINISLDSLQPARFRSITGHERMGEVLEGVAAARAAGFTSIKINTVLMRGVNDDELDALIDFVTEKALVLRFIEVMRTNDNPAFFETYHLPGHWVSQRLEHKGWAPLPRAPGAGPAVDYGHPASPGRIGIIAPYSQDFCASCNRLRVSATGRFHLCLFGDGGFDLRPLLQHDGQIDALTERISRLTLTKAATHRLHEGDSGATPHLASIGG